MRCSRPSWQYFMGHKGKACYVGLAWLGKHVPAASAAVGCAKTAASGKQVAEHVDLSLSCRLFHASQQNAADAHKAQRQATSQLSINRF